MKVLGSRKILLLVGGGIAAYKAPLLVRELIANGAEVRCVLTANAAQFVAPLALQTVSNHAVASDLFDPQREEQINHIELARWPDAILVAPATANLLARAAAGMANDLATTLLLATAAPIVLAPAMNTHMWRHPATQRNLRTLESFGARVIAPSVGELACGEEGEGRQPDADVLVEHIAMALSPQPLEGKKVVIATGPTREFLDPVRFLSNPSTGKMGVALARAASWLGAEVSLVSGPGVEVGPALVLKEWVRVETVSQMAAAVFAAMEGADWLFMPAAVGDWSVKDVLTSKRKKSASSDETWTLELVRTIDILAAAVQRRVGTRPRIVGFSAETDDREENAALKLRRKGCDAILANWVRSAHGDSFGADSIELVAIGADGWRETFSGSKLSVAAALLPRLIDRLEGDAHE